MRTAQFSLAGMVTFIAAVAVALAALRSATEFWLGAIAAITVGGFVFALVCAVRGPARAVWIGSTAAGGIYLALVFAPWCSSHVGPRLPTSALLGRAHDALGLRPRVRIERYDPQGRLTSTLHFEADDGSAEWLGTAIFLMRPEWNHFGFGNEWGNSGILLPTSDRATTAGLSTSSWVSSAQIRDDREVFLRIGHILTAWFLALIGGLGALAARSVIRRRETAEAQSALPVPAAANSPVGLVDLPAEKACPRTVPPGIV